MTSSRPVDCARMLVWHLVSTLAVLLLLPLVRSEPVWNMSRAQLIPFGLLVLGFLVSGLIPVLACRRGNRLTTLQSLLVTTAIFGLVFLAFLFADWSSPRFLLGAVFGAALLVIPVVNARPGSLAPILPLAALVLGSVLFTIRRKPPAPPMSAPGEALIRTTLYNLQLDFQSGVIPRPGHVGGGLARIGDQFLLMTGDGLFYLFGWSGPADSLSVRALPYRVPANLPEFRAAVGLAEAPAAARRGDLTRFWFRGALGLQTETRRDSLRVYASYLYWLGERKCFVERVAMLQAPLAAVLRGDSVPDWRMIYETAPCLPLHGSKRPEEWLNDASWPVSGMAAGGRLIVVGRDSLLLSVGDFGFDGVTIPGRPIAQDRDGSYGKTILIHLNGRSPEIFTSGHRNPQGLHRDADGSIWLTEHGPQGGDELNLIAAGKNYGWPLVTFGADYGSTEWPLSQRQGSHEGYEAPAYAWVPSIAVSDLLRIENGQLFPAWRGDLLVGTLGKLELHRVRTRDGRVVFTERFAVGRQVRALAEGEDGRIVLWTDDHSIGSMTPNRGGTRAALFALRCGGCHDAGPGTGYKIGPNLAGVVGRPVATAPTEFSFSPALRAVGGNWTSARLEAFIANPRALAPNTTMAYPGLADSAERTAIIEYLKTRR